MSIPVAFFSKRGFYQRTEASRIIKEEFDRRFAGRSDVKLLPLDNNAFLYNELGVYPPIKYFYLPAVTYAVYPEAADSQYSAIMDGTFDVIISCYKNEGHYIYGNGEYDANVYDYLQKEYDNAAGYGVYQMWVRR